MGIQNKEYCGTIVFELDGQEYDIVSIDTNTKTGAKTVQTMNSKNRPLGSACGVDEHTLDIQAAIPLDGSEPNWRAMKGATITLYPACGTGGKREVYTGVTVEEVGGKYGVGKEATRSIKAHALDYNEV